MERMNKHLAPGHWIAIATVAVVVLGGVISVALSEQNARLENAIAGAQTRMSDTQEQIAEGLARMEGELETTQERLAGFEDRVYDRFDQVDDRFDNIDDRFDRIDNTLDRLIQLNLDP